MTILLFFGVLFVLILVHEWGHFITAKKTGMRVDEFGIGFPPKLFGVKRGETEYTMNLLPIGGFVRIFGEDAAGAAESADYARSFIARPKWAQAIVLVAGVTMNVLFAWFLFAIVLMVGLPTAVDEATATPEARLVVASVLPGSPADLAGVPAGAVVTSLSAGEDSIEAKTPSAFRAFSETRPNEPLSLTVQSGGESKTLTVTPEKGLVAEAPDQVAVGVSLVLVENVTVAPHVALWRAVGMTYDSTIAITVSIASLLADSATLSADLSQVAGPVGIVGLVGDAASFGFTSLLLFTAAISLNLAVINMLPFPALDGGRLLFVAIESVTQRPINPKWVLRLNTVGFVLLLTLMVAVTWNDIARLL